MKALVTGGAGFIGRNIAKLCFEKEWEVTTLDTAYESTNDGKVRGSIEDYQLLEKLSKDKDIIFHEAAITSPPQFDEDPLNSFRINTMGTLNVLRAASVNRVKRVVLASSSSVYGNIKSPGREDMVKPAYENLYPLSKSVNEETSKFFSARGEIETICLRYFNTYGIGENSKGAYSSVISKFVNDIRSGETPIIFGDGEQKRDFVFVEDVAEANLIAAENGVSGEYYNVGTGQSTTFNDIYNIVRKEMSSKVDPVYQPIPFKSYQMFTQADVSKAKKELGFRSSTDIRSGVRKMLAETE